MWQLIGAFVLAFVLAWVITPWVVKKAFVWGAVDMPDPRKVHCKPMPRLGGLAVYIAFIGAVLVGMPWELSTWGLVLGVTCITLVGIADDIKGLSPWVKLLGQVIAALVVIPFGIQVEFFTNPLNSGLVYLGFFSIPVTVFWLVAVTNAINLIDGLDGLATGVSAIAALTMAAVGLTQFGFGQGGSVLLSLLLAAAALGFLRHNYHPAKIFLGDSGSMLLGFSLGLISIMGLTKSATAVSVILPLVILGIPLLDTVCAILRRYQGHKPIFQPDKGHLHHRLLALGLSHAQSVLVIYGVSLVMGLSAVVLNLISSDQAVVLLVVLSVMVLVGANKIGVWGRHKKREKPATNKKVDERPSRL